VCYVHGPSREIETLDDLIFGRFVTAARRLGWSFLPALVCGPAFGYGWHVGVDPGLTADEAANARRHILDAIEAEAESRRLQITFAGVSDEERGLKALLGERRYLKSRNVPVAVLDLRWASFEEYLQALPSRSRREFRRQINRNRSAGVVVERLEAPGELENRFLELIDLNARKHNAFSFGLGPGFLSALKRAFGSNVRIFTARKSGGVSGVCVMLVREDAAFPIVVGVDGSQSSDDYTYFQIVYNAPIADAIESRLRRMYYGRGMYDLKVRRGCALVDTWIYSRGSAPTRMAIASWFALASVWNRRKLSSRARRAVNPADS
jgi:predicted N-acyltransferase